MKLASIIFCVTLLLVGCDVQEDAPDPPAGFDSDGHRHLIDTGANTKGKKQGRDYIWWAVDRDRAATHSFAGYGCTGDCAGHKAGFSWARVHGLTKAAQCEGSSWSFVEGCAAFTQHLPANVSALLGSKE